MNANVMMAGQEDFVRQVSVFCVNHNNYVSEFVKTILEDTFMFPEI